MVIPLFVRNVINIISAPAKHSLSELWLNGAILTVLILQNIPVHTLCTRLFSLSTRKMEARLRGA